MARVLGAILLALVGYQLGRWLTADILSSMEMVFALSGAVLGIVIGLLFTPLLTIVPFNAIRRRLAAMAAADLIAVGVGLVVGLVISALLTIPLRALPGVLGSWMPIAAAIAICYISITIAVFRRRELTDYFAQRGSAPSRHDPKPPADRYLLDTSAIIDGRIAEVTSTGFLRGTLMVPQFVLHELQLIADSSDSLRRARGRRGLDVLAQLKAESRVSVEITDGATDHHEDVDGALVSIARERSYPIITNDYNLNKVATLQGIEMLNINDLAHAVRPLVLPGEHLRVAIVQEGKELDQGVGYLDDGTMIVVENGRKCLHSEVEVLVTRLLQTIAGRMIFAQLPSATHQHRKQVDRVEQ